MFKFIEVFLGIFSFICVSNWSLFILELILNILFKIFCIMEFV